MNTHVHYFSHVVLAFTLALSMTAYGAEVNDEADAEAARTVALFMEACVLGNPNRQGRVTTLDSHPRLERMPLPENSPAAKAGRMVWASPPDAIFVLEPNMECYAMVNNEKIKDRLSKFIEHSKLGASSEKDSAAAFQVSEPSEEAIQKYKARNIAVKTFVHRRPNSDIGLLLGLETSIVPSQRTDPVRIWVRGISWK